MIIIIEELVELLYPCHEFLGVDASLRLSGPTHALKELLEILGEVVSSWINRLEVKHSLSELLAVEEYLHGGVGIANVAVLLRVSK